MVSDYGMYQGYNVEGELNITANPTIGAATSGVATGTGCPPVGGVTLPPVYEGAQERQVHRQIVHEVPHVCPINTRIINHHIYRHTYSPCYTCCEENEVCNIQEGCCNKF